MRFNRGHFSSALLGGLVVAVVVAALPAVAGNGDYLILGEKNTARRITRVTTKNGFLLRTTKADTPAATFEVVSGPPIAVNSAALVEELNADLLYGLTSERVRTWSNACSSEDAPDGTNTYYRCSAPLNYWVSLPGGGMALATGSAEILYGSTTDALTCSLQYKKSGDGSWTEISGTRRTVQVSSSHPYEICATDGWLQLLDADGGDYRFSLYIQGLDADTDVVKTATWWLYRTAPYGVSDTADAGPESEVSPTPDR